MLLSTRTAFVNSIVAAIVMSKHSVQVSCPCDTCGSNVVVIAENIAESFIAAGGGVLFTKPTVDPHDPHAVDRWEAYAKSYSSLFGETIEPTDTVQYPNAILSLLSDAQEFRAVACLSLQDPIVEQARCKEADMVNAAKLMLCNMTDAARDEQGCGEEGPEGLVCTHHSDGFHYAFCSEADDNWPIQQRTPAAV